jgi:predicted MFS family arabinose efflux permease
MDPWWLVPPSLLLGLSVSFTFVPAIATTMNVTPASQQGQASGVLLTSQMLGATIGMAICSTIVLETGSYRPVFLTLAALVILTLAAAWVWLDRPRAGGAEEQTVLGELPTAAGA